MPLNDFVGILGGSIEDLHRVYHPPEPYPQMVENGVWKLREYVATAVDQGERLLVTWTYNDERLAQITWKKDATIAALANVVVVFLLAFAKGGRFAEIGLRPADRGPSSRRFTKLRRDLEARPGSGYFIVAGVLSAIVVAAMVYATSHGTPS